MNPSWTLAWLACASTALAGAGVRQQPTTPQPASTPTVDDLFQPAPAAELAHTTPVPAASGGVSQPSKAGVAPAAKSSGMAPSLPGSVQNAAPSASSAAAQSPRSPAAPAIALAPMPGVGELAVAGPSSMPAPAAIARSGAVSSHAPSRASGVAGGQHGGHVGLTVPSDHVAGVAGGSEFDEFDEFEAPEPEEPFTDEAQDEYDEDFEDELAAHREAFEELQAALEEQRAAFEASRRELLERQRELVERQREQRQRARELAQRANERARATRERERQHERQHERGRAVQRTRDAAPSCDTFTTEAHEGTSCAPCPDSSAVAPCSPCPPCPPCAPKAGASAPAHGAPSIVRVPGSARVTRLDRDHALELAEAARRAAGQAGAWAAITVPGDQGGARCRVWHSSDGEGQAWAFETAEGTQFDAEELRRAAEAYAARAHEFADQARAYVWDGEQLRAFAQLGELGRSGELAKLADLARLGELGELGKLGQTGELARLGDLSTWYVDGRRVAEKAAAEARVCEELAEADAADAAEALEDFDFEVDVPDEVEVDVPDELDVDVFDPTPSAYYDNAFATQVPEPAGEGAMHELTALIREMSTEVRGLRDDLRSLRDGLRRDRGTR